MAAALQRPRNLIFRSCPKTSLGRFIARMTEMFLLITPVGMTFFLVYNHGSSWNQVSWAEYLNTFERLIVPILVNGFMTWHSDEELIKTMNSQRN